MSSKHEPGDTTSIGRALATLSARIEAEEVRHRDTAARMVAASGDVAGRVSYLQPGNLAARRVLDEQAKP